MPVYGGFYSVLAFIQVLWKRWQLTVRYGFCFMPWLLVGETGWYAGIHSVIADECGGKVVWKGDGIRKDFLKVWS